MQVSGQWANRSGDQREDVLGGVGGPIGGEQLYACCLVIREGVRNKHDTTGHVESLTRQSGVWAYPLFIRVQALPLPRSLPERALP